MRKPRALFIDKGTQRILGVAKTPEEVAAVLARIAEKQKARRAVQFNPVSL